MTTDFDIYQKIKNKLIEQNEQSTDVSGECAYRGFTFLEEHLAPIQNLRCAVGHIIDDKYYHEELENKSASDDRVLEAIVKSNPDWSMDGVSKDLICKLQTIHDILIPEDWSVAFDEKNWLFDNDGKFIGVLSSIVDSFTTLLKSDYFMRRVYLNRSILGSSTKEQLV